MTVQKLTKAEAGRLGAAKSKIVSARKKAERIIIYGQDPAICEQCNKDLSYEKRNNKFCNSSCAAKINNVKFPKKSRSKTYGKMYICIFCGRNDNQWTYSGVNKYCSNNCFQDSRRAIRTVLVKSGEASSNQCKQYLIETLGNKCQKCNWSEINPVTGNVPIELEHKDGHSENNNLINLELLCPNCHSLTPTYKALNKGNGRHKRRERYAEGKSFSPIS